ncbi:arylsulfatase precursor [Metarhizium album ARSEF 1941]|uniref:Arylsulfatase n=1 Tax=Metarhizium album (strain ARSEF 1941) TaxID=1081103 RepID=A0A0B2WW50_METAS|nr:arylsulfatase precursor [Metarhizium album ARSEF 1941]KHO00417.1 arylsulfatase precursor [Metarhizium album ARSEF 1941]
MAVPLFLLAALILTLRMAGGKELSKMDLRPNFIFIITDDQDLHMNSLDYQDTVREELVQKGTTFNKHFCTVSLCCPSRVSLLTGKAAHNTNVTDVKYPWGGYRKFITQKLNDAYLPVWLQQWGYNTYYAGKLMNQHSTKTYNWSFAKGWTRSDFLLDPGTYSYLDGIMALDRDEYRSIKGQYSTDVIANRSLEFLGNAMDAGRPFFLGIAPIAPHANTGFTSPVPAERHSHLFPDAVIPRTPSFNPKTRGHVSYLKTLPRLNSTQIEYIDEFYRSRLRALQAVDDMVGSIVDALQKQPEVLANTYIIYTSDNGYHLGHHRLPPGKTCNIEEDINVPFIVRGPGVTHGAQVTFPTSHVDIAPTLFKLAGIPLREDFDGVPIPVRSQDRLHQVRDNEHVNIEYWGSPYVEGELFDNLRHVMAKNTYKTLRVVGKSYDFMYGVWCTDEHQLYDMRADPHQMNNLYGIQGNTSGYDVAALTARLETLLLTLKNCKGRVCRQPWERIFPDPSDLVFSLEEAMNPKFDDFFLRRQPRITFSECTVGYMPELEGASGPVVYTDWSKYFSEKEWADGI